jgi:hypothetical protein
MQGSILGVDAQIDVLRIFLCARKHRNCVFRVKVGTVSVAKKDTP